MVEAKSPSGVAVDLSYTSVKGRTLRSASCRRRYAMWCVNDCLTPFATALKAQYKKFLGAIRDRTCLL